MAAEAKIRVRADGVEQAAASLGKMSKNMQRVKRASDHMTIAQWKYDRSMKRARLQMAAEAAALKNRPSLYARTKAGLLNMRTAMVGVGVYGFGRLVTGSLRAANAMKSAENGFVRLTRARGIGGARDQLQRFNTQLDGMIDRATVASMASRLMATNSSLTVDNVAKILRYSRDWADTTGQELLPVVQSLSSALGGMELETLRRLGLEVRFQDILVKEAKARGKTVATLGEQERRLIKTKVIMDAIAAKHAEIGRTVLTAANNIDRMNANWQNLQAKLGEGFGELGGGALQVVADTMQGKTKDIFTRAGMDAPEGGLIDSIFPDWMKPGIATTAVGFGEYAPQGEAIKARMKRKAYELGRAKQMMKETGAVLATFKNPVFRVFGGH